MTNRSLARLVLVALICVVVSNVTVWIFGAFEALGATLGALAIGVVTWWCRRQALVDVQKSSRYWLWMTLPLVLFTVAPIAVRIVMFFTSSEPTGILTLANVVAFAVSFVVPVVLLGVVYVALVRRETAPAPPPPPAQTASQKT